MNSLNNEKDSYVKIEFEFEDRKSADRMNRELFEMVSETVKEVIEKAIVVFGDKKVSFGGKNYDYKVDKNEMVEDLAVVISGVIKEKTSLSSTQASASKEKIYGITINVLDEEVTNGVELVLDNVKELKDSNVKKSKKVFGKK